MIIDWIKEKWDSFEEQAYMTLRDYERKILYLKEGNRRGLIQLVISSLCLFSQPLLPPNIKIVLLIIGSLVGFYHFIDKLWCYQTRIRLGVRVESINSGCSTRFVLLLKQLSNGRAYAAYFKPQLTTGVISTLHLSLPGLRDYQNPAVLLMFQYLDILLITNSLLYADDKRLKEAHSLLARLVPCLPLTDNVDWVIDKYRAMVEDCTDHGDWQ